MNLNVVTTADSENNGIPVTNPLLLESVVVFYQNLSSHEIA